RWCASRCVRRDRRKCAPALRNVLRASRAARWRLARLAVGVPSPRQSGRDPLRRRESRTHPLPLLGAVVVDRSTAARGRPARRGGVPGDAPPADGAFVRCPATELLDIVALESARSGAVIVGEDLGTVEDEVREHLAQRGVLSYRLVWFEDELPDAFPTQALAA